MPRSCVALLQEKGCWNLPYKFQYPSGLRIVHGQLPPDYNKLDVDVTSESLVDVTEKDLGEENGENKCEHLTENEEISNSHCDLEDYN